MKSASLIRKCLIALATIMFLLPSVASAQAKCDRRGRIIQDADVYKQVPKYVTGSGWHGERVTTLRSHTQVYLCGEQSAGFGFSTKTWMQIAYEGANRSWQYGWVLKDTLTILSSRLRENDIGSKYALITDAFAGAPSTGQDQTPWTLGPPPVTPPPQSEEKSASVTKEPGSASLSDLGELYWPLFVAMLLGMLAKAGVDWLDASDKSLMRQHLRNALVTILVSPIVFLGFLSAGQFSTSTQTFVVLFLLSFQNGFFWQTVLKRNMGGTQPNAAPDTRGT
jgi:hypothetical protein